MTNSNSFSYKDAGVDVTAGYKAVELMSKSVMRTKIPGVLSSLGGFGGAFEIQEGYKHPVLISGTDGVGTKLKIAFALDKHDTIGIDCVAMCVHDVLACGAKPLFFLDYIATGKNYPEKIASIVSGVAEGCVQSGCALIGGETAEMPGFYPEDEYDLAGFTVGIVEREKILNPNNINAGDVIIALPSSGLHSNGFSLVRKLLEPSDELLTPTRIYVKDVLPVLDYVKSIAHITGGGFFENIPRALPENLTAKINLSALKILPVFEKVQRAGNLSQHEMFNTFNMGVGMILISSPDDANKILNSISDAYIIGEVIKGEREVTLC